MQSKRGYITQFFRGMIYRSATPTLTDGDSLSHQSDVNGNLKVSISGGSTPASSSAANTARTTSTGVLPVQHIDAAGTVGGVTMNTALDKTNDSVTNYPAGCTCTTVDLATDADVVVTAAPSYLMGVYVSVVMSAHAAIIKDSATAVITLPASTAAGTKIDCHSTTFASTITVESNDAATGTLLIFWRAA